MAGVLQPLDQKFAIVDPAGRPTDYFIRWAQTRQIDITDGITLQDLIDYLTAHTLQEGSGIQITPSGSLNDNPTIDADAQEILDQISSTRGTVLYRGLLGWAGLAPGGSGLFLKSNGAGADPSWAAGGGSGSGLTPYVRGAGRYLPPDTLNFGTTTNVGVAGLVYYFPFTKNATIDALVAEVTTAIAGSNIRMALYDSDANGLPGNLIYDLGNVSAAGIGLKTLVLPAPYVVGGIVYLARQDSAGYTLRGGTESLKGLNQLFGNSGGINAATGATRLTQPQAFGAFPANGGVLGAFTYNTGASMLAARLA